jgi:type VII secretion protein EccB
MATKRDLVEAHSFSRRRLVTAFVSGAPGGREVEPARPGRTIVGGVALGVLLMAGAAVSGVLAGRTQVDWNNPGLIISKDNGQAYVITRASAHPVLNPIVNITSARLIIGSSAEPVVVPEKTIQEQTIGPEIGILGAPATVPETDGLVETGWTSCTADGKGVRTYLSAQPEASYADGAGFVVESGGSRWLVATAGGVGGGYRYPLPAVGGGAQDRFLQAVGLGVGNEAVRVPEAWLGLWPAGGDLGWQSFGIPQGAYGRAVGYGAQIHVPHARVGDVVQVADTGYLLAPTGPVRLTSFAQAVYEAAGPPSGTFHTWHEPTMDKDAVVSPFASANWPDGSLTPTSGELCAVLQTSAGARPTVALATDPGADATAAGVPAGHRDAGVAPRGGAYVLSADFTQTTHGLPFLIDLKGSSHLLEGAAAANLGYGGFPAPVVPDTWVKLFSTGAVLSPDLALCEPEKTTSKGCR